MSWAEDNGIDGWDIECTTPSDNWSSGIHIDSCGKVHYIEEMTDSHLKNTIKYFGEKGFNTKILEEEYNNRKLKVKSNK